jgi:hypothetical protein
MILGSESTDAAHEAIRDLVRARATAARMLSKARQHLQAFCCAMTRIYRGARAWTLAYRRWLTTVRFEHPAQQIVLQDYIHAVEDAQTRRDRLTRQIEEVLPSWSMAPVVAGLQAMRGVALVVAHGCGGSRRLPPLRQSSAADGLPRLGAQRTFVREHNPSRRHHQGRQPPGGRVLIEGAWTYRMTARVSRKLRPSRAAVHGHSGHCVESAGPAVCAISAPGRRRQAKGRGHHGDRPRDGRLHLGDRPHRPTGSRLMSCPRNGPADGRSRAQKI